MPETPTTPVCHPDPQLCGGAPGCPYIVPCTERCHIRWLDGDDQITTDEDAEEAPDAD